MYCSKFVPSVIFKSIIVLLGVSSLSWALGLITGNLKLNSLNYFTELSNLLVTVYFIIDIVYLLRNRNAQTTTPKPWCHPVKYACLMAITVTFLVAHFLLGGGTFFDENGTFVWTTPVLHYIIPIMTILDWIIFDEKGYMGFRDVLAGLVLPLVYFAYVLIRVGVFGFGFGLQDNGSRYPYDFIDVDVLGLQTVLITACVLVAVFVVLSGMYLGIDRGLAKIKRGRIS